MTEVKTDIRIKRKMGIYGEEFFLILESWFRDTNIDTRKKISSVNDRCYTLYVPYPPIIN